MISEQPIRWNASYVLASKARDYFQLSKFTLSFMVVFSSVVGYWMVPGVKLEWSRVLLLFTGGLLVTGSANAINQIMERRTDGLMKRTAGRPLPGGRMKPAEASVLALIMSLAGLTILGRVFNWSTAGLSLLCVLLYGFIYTPWKKWNSLAVLVGAIPGALPPLIGWVAGSGTLSAGGWALFAIQFLWQFPHFWAIAWIAYGDYRKAGFRLLPSAEGPNRFTALQAMIYVLLLLPVGLIPYFMGLSGIYYAGAEIAAGLFFFYRALNLYRFCDVKSARQLMFGSYIYLTIIQLVMLADKVKMI
ncbi:MAG TPA: heme o synthase [Chitinophagaceae bacterium]|nr:heme o synthase [Chitinophagaceae bacterium]